jgi:8-oxo-dGTP pyrophosphatase MutT (NUDIX family)
MTRNKRKVAKVLVADEAGDLLVLKRSRYTLHRPRTWDLPGGVIKRNELPKVGVIRETAQETGLELELDQLEEIIAIPALCRTILRGKVEVVTAIFKYVLDQRHPDINLSREHETYSWVDEATFRGLTIPEKYKEASGDTVFWDPDVAIHMYKQPPHPNYPASTELTA